MLELLAPAGDLNSFEAAINCGADAVYLGLSDFNARKKAENFNADNLRDCVRRAHFFGVKVYITVNTLVRDSEMPSLLSLVKTAVEAKADAFIVQDLGVARCLRNAFPNIVLHASTQMGVHNLYGAQVAEKIGFKRVILSRETKLADIRAIREGTNLEIEYFVQGALCVAFSGNCYLSAVEQNASGNRGLCKQLCRLPYKATVGGNSADGYLLSAKDLCLADSIKDLAEAGVMSFKIEGRLRREGYVAGTVSVYRRIIDDIQRGTQFAANSFEKHTSDVGAKLTADDRKRLQIAYCRGGGYLERAYLDDGAPSVIESNFNNHTGLAVGAVKSVAPFKSDLYKVTVTSDYPLSKGDGLKFFDNLKTADKRNPSAKSNAHNSKATFTDKWVEVASLGIGDVSENADGIYTFVTKTPVKVGWRVHLISRAGEVFATRKVSVELAVTAKIGKPLTISATAENGVCANVSGDICERAKTSPMSANDIANQASKTADSGFYVTKCEVDTDGVFIAKSAFNALRRDLFAKLADEVISANEKHTVGIDESVINSINNSLSIDFEHINLRFVHSDELKGRFDTSEFAADNDTVFVLCPEKYGTWEIERMRGVLGVNYDKIALQLPVIANNMDMAIIEKILAELPQIHTLVSENIYGFAFADKGYKVIAGAGHNVLNAYAKAECLDLGADSVLPAIESDRGVHGAPANVPVCGVQEIPLMTFAHCPYKTVFGNECDKCSYREGMTIAREDRRYRVRRTKLHGCYFGLY